MSKKITVTNYRVEVYPGRAPYVGWTDKQTCELIEDQINRHCDSVFDTSIVHDSEGQCEHCGWQWTEDSDVFNGGCCEKDIADGHAAGLCNSQGDTDSRRVEVEG